MSLKLHAMMKLLLCLSLTLVNLTSQAADRIQPGKLAPDFELADQEGKSRRLSSLLMEKPVALVFFRSADWCPFCQRQLIQLQKDHSRFQDAGWQLVALSYDKVETLKAFSDRRGIQYPLLSDPGSQTIDAYGLRNESSKQGIPHPAVLLISKDGKVAEVLMEEGYRNRPTTEAILEAAAKVKGS